MSEYTRKQTPRPKLEELDPTGTLFDPALAETAASNPTAESAESAEAALERRLDEEADKLGSYVLARERLGLPPIESDSEDEDRPTRTPNTAARPRRVNRRGGRSYNEGSDSEHDPYWNASAPELTADQRLASAAGLAEVRKALEDSLRHAEPPTEEDILAERQADAARIRDQARQSWAEFDDK